MMHPTTWAVALLAVLSPVTAAPADSPQNTPITPLIMDDATFYNLTLPEYTPDGLKVVDLRSDSALEKRAGCTGNEGVANSQCVRYYSSKGCTSDSHIKGYKPTCGGNCYVDKFRSVKVFGDGTYNTDCELYSDTGCQNSVGRFGNGGLATKCRNYEGWSMKCYYRC